MQALGNSGQAGVRAGTARRPGGRGGAPARWADRSCCAPAAAAAVEPHCDAPPFQFEAATAAQSLSLWQSAQQAHAGPQAKPSPYELWGQHAPHVATVIRGGKAR